MKKSRKKIYLIIFIIFLLLCCFFGYKKFTKKEPEEPEKIENVESTITPLLYEVTKEGSSNKIYLFGSIHVANSKDLIFPQYVLDAYNNSNYLACEYDVVAYSADSNKLMKSAIEMMYQDGTTIKDHLSKEAYDKLVNFLTAKKAYSSVYENFKLYFFVSLFTELAAKDAKIDINTGVDEYFLKKATTDKKNILEIESYDYQINLFDSFEDELYELILINGIDNYDESIIGLKKLYEAWKNGSEAEILKYGSDDAEVLDSYTEGQEKLIENYNKKLIDERNEKMLDKAIEYFNNDQDVFYMVGSFHIIGDNGIANQLKAQGFTVKQINY